MACNHAIIKMLGYDSEQQVLALPAQQLSPQFQPNGIATSELAIAMIKLAMDKGQHRYECVHTRSNGENFWVDVVLTRLILDSKNVLHVAWRDISKQKQLEADIIKERDIANQANKSKSEFLANMSHELRTPMHGILSFSNIALDKPERLTTDKTLQYFRHIKNSADRLLALINDLLDLSKLESGKMELHYSKNSLMQVAQDCIVEQRARLFELDKQILWEKDIGMGNGMFDAVRIGQVITNLISNAIKFTSKGKHIELSISQLTECSNDKQELKPQQQQRRMLLFSVRDFGKGIAIDDMELIFDKFSQGTVIKEHKGGTGLGLAICKEIIAAHKGVIWADNHPQGGAIFKFKIPS